MKSSWYSLAWKEWHEHKWKLASIVAVMWSVTALIIASEKTASGVLMAATVVGTLLSAAPLAIFVGLGVAAGERSHRTLPFLQALPVPMWRVALHKLAAGWATVVASVLMTLLVVLAWSKYLDLRGIDHREGVDFVNMLYGSDLTGSWLGDAAIVALIVASGFYVWAAAAGANRRDEVSAGAVALAVMLGFWLLVGLMLYLLDRGSPGLAASRENPPTWLTVLGLSAAPGGFASVPDAADGRSGYVTIGLITAVVTQIAWAGWYVRRFGRIENVEVRSPRTAICESGRPEWLAPPRRSAFTAIAWQQFRESGPIVVAGLAGVAGIVAAIALPNLERIDAASFAQILGVSTMVLGVAVSLVVGIGVFLNDLTPSLNAFWRSRPIHSNSWFWTKLVSGWLALLGSFSVPLLVAGSILWAESDDQSLDSANLFIVLVPLSIYTASAAMTCLVRHAVYAAILSIPILYSGILLVGLALAVGRVAGWLDAPNSNDFWQMSDRQIAVGFVVSTAISTVAAWLAVRNDWGWKSRY
jgi:hypothetical protein